MVQCKPIKKQEESYMANVKNGRKPKSLASLALTLVVLIIASMLGITIPGITDNPEGTLTITMIDVGQGDSFLIEQGDEVALIDCGTSSAGKVIIEYLQKKGITKINKLFGTHPHDDHEGGMLYVINNVEVEKVILPDIKDEHANTNWYKKLFKALKDGGYDLEYVEIGTVYNLGEATITVIGPISDPGDEKNNYSTVLKVSFGEQDAIFTGDAEVPVEQDMIEAGQNLQAEILKIGHHGSETSSCEAFLDAVNPTYALISCGLDNQHEHPKEEVMQRLEARNIEVYRTDECGTVVVTITATDIIFNCNPGDYLSGIELVEREGAK